MKTLKTILFITGILILPLWVGYFLLNQIATQATVKINQITIKAPLNAKVIKINVNNGQQVSKNQPLVTLDAPEIRQQLDNNRIAESNLLTIYNRQIQQFNLEKQQLSSLVIKQKAQVELFSQYRAQGAVSLLQMSNAITEYNNTLLSLQKVSNDINNLKIETNKSISLIHQNNIILQNKLDQLNVIAPESGIINHVLVADNLFVHENDDVITLDAGHIIVVQSSKHLSNTIRLKAGLHLYTCNVVNISNKDQRVNLLKLSSDDSLYLLDCKLPSKYIIDNQKYFVF